MAKGALRAVVGATLQSSNATDPLKNAVNVTRNIVVASKRGKRKPLRKVGRQVWGALGTAHRGLKEYGNRMQRVVVKTKQQNAAMQRETQKRQELLQQRLRTVENTRQAQTQKLAQQVRAQRIGVNTSQASTALKNNQTNLLQSIARANANLKIQAMDLKRNGAKFQRKRQLAKQDAVRQVRNFKRKRSEMETEIRENVANYKANVQNALQTQKVQLGLNQLGAKVWRANAQTAQKRARLAAQASPYEQQAAITGAKSVQATKVFNAGTQPLLAMRPASSYLAPRRATQPISQLRAVT